MAQKYTSNQPPGFKNYVENIIIFGAGGSIGKYIAQSLIAQGKHKVAAITRPDSKSKLPAGLDEIKKVEYHDSLVEAMKGQDVLVITMTRTAPPDSQNKLIDAAVKADVKYIMPNEYGTDQSHEALRRPSIINIRQYIEKVGKGKTHWIGLCSGFWYEHSLASNSAAGGKDRFGFDFRKKQ